VATVIDLLVGEPKALDLQATKTHKNNKKAADWKKIRSRD